MFNSLRLFSDLDNNSNKHLRGFARKCFLARTKQACVQSTPLVRPMLEALEPRVVLNNQLLSSASVGFAASSGALSILGDAGGATAEVTLSADGAVAVTVNGRILSSDPSSPFFTTALAGANAAALHQIAMSGGGSTDALTLGNLMIGSSLVVSADGGVTIAGNVTVARKLSVTTAALTIDGTAKAGSMKLKTPASLTSMPVAAFWHNSMATAARLRPPLLIL